MKITEGHGRFVAPNLTPVADGIVQLLTEQEFIERFRLRAQSMTASDGGNAGNARSNCQPTPSAMPWAAFARMTDDDLAAIYRYLKSLPASPTSR